MNSDGSTRVTSCLNRQVSDATIDLAQFYRTRWNGCWHATAREYTIDQYRRLNSISAAFELNRHGAHELARSYTCDPCQRAGYSTTALQVFLIEEDPPYRRGTVLKKRVIAGDVLLDSGARW